MGEASGVSGEELFWTELLLLPTHPLSQSGPNSLLRPTTSNKLGEGGHGPWEAWEEEPRGCFLRNCDWPQTPEVTQGPEAEGASTPASPSLPAGLTAQRTKSPGIHMFRTEGIRPAKQDKEAGCSPTIGGQGQLPKEGCRAGGACPAGEGLTLRQGGEDTWARWQG